MRPDERKTAARASKNDAMGHRITGYAPPDCYSFHPNLYSFAFVDAFRPSRERPSQSLRASRPPRTDDVSRRPPSEPVDSFHRDRVQTSRQNEPNNRASHHASVVAGSPDP